MGLDSDGERLLEGIILNVHFDVAWIKRVVTRLPQFMLLLQAKQVPGFYSYSLSGDKWPPSTEWGLGQAVFASKIFFMLGKFPDSETENLAKFILHFQSNDGSISDPKVELYSRWQRCKSFVKSRKISGLFNVETNRAETRQSYAALRCLNRRANQRYLALPNTKAAVKDYLHNLNWRNPWNAASHFSHLVFFLHYNNLWFATDGGSQSLIDDAFSEIQTYRLEDGSWGVSANTSLQQRINGAMKILTGYMAAERDCVDRIDPLIDLCLSAIHDQQACDHLNIVLVLAQCLKFSTHRRQEVENFFAARLQLFREHYREESGGFSFYKEKSNRVYYGAAISKGKNEADIHGTVLFLWGIALMTHALNLDKEINLKLPF